MIQRGDFYLVKKGKGDPTDPKKQRIFVVVSRQASIETGYSTVICAPVSTNYIPGLSTQVRVNENDGFKHLGAIHCDGLRSIEKSNLTDYKEHLSDEKMQELDTALAIALGLI